MRRNRLSIALALSVIALISINAHPIAGAEPVCASWVRGDIEGTEGDDVLYGTAGDDIIRGREGDDTIYGRGGNDLICAGRGNDIVGGGEGDDIVHGGFSADELRGGAGDDYFFPALGDDLVDGGDGSDRVDLTSRGWWSGGDVVEADLVAGTSTSPEGDDTLADIEDLSGVGNVTFYGDAEPNRLEAYDVYSENLVNGRGGNDNLIIAGGTEDAAYGGAGDDLIDASGEGSDFVSGGSGDDDIDVTWNDATVRAGAGGDWVALAENVVDIDGGEGVNDGVSLHKEVQGGVEVDLAQGTLRGASEGILSGIEHVLATRAADRVLGTEAPNVLTGLARDDHLDGRAGEDALYGDTGSDVLFGGDGDDLLFGSAGRDRLDGESGWDDCRRGERMSGCEATRTIDPDDSDISLDLRYVRVELLQDGAEPMIGFTFSFYEPPRRRDLGNVTAYIEPLGRDPGPYQHNVEISRGRGDDRFRARWRRDFVFDWRKLPLEQPDPTSLRTQVPLAWFDENRVEEFVWFTHVEGRWWEHEDDFVAYDDGPSGQNSTQT
jgi:Ca2+-binding RTX toxin-like protein